jgi:hypothetical protein
LRPVKRKPADGATQWSTRRLAQQLGVSHMMVVRVWRKHALQPHRLEGYLASDDPDFETKAADIIGLYLNPPQHAAMFCVDEQTAMQALERLDPVLPLSPGRAELRGFECHRHDTLSLYTAFNTKTGEVLGKTASRHTSANSRCGGSGADRTPSGRDGTSPYSPSRTRRRLTTKAARRAASVAWLAAAKSS